MTVNGGINVSDMDIQHIKTNPKIGYNFNVTLEYNLPKRFFLQTGLEFTNKGAKLKDKTVNYMWGSEIIKDLGHGNFAPDEQYMYLRVIEGKYNMQYFTIPLMGGYRLPVSSQLRMNLSLGPYFSFGVGGKYNWKQGQKINKVQYTNEYTELENDYPGLIGFEGKSFDILKRFDMGLKGNVGIEFNRALLNIGYEYGFIDQFKDDNISSYNMNLFVTVGFRIF